MLETTHRRFLVKFATFLRTPFFKEHLRWVVASEVFCKDFVDTSYENVSCRILEALLWLQLMFLITIALLLVSMGAP